MSLEVETECLHGAEMNLAWLNISGYDKDEDKFGKNIMKFGLLEIVDNYNIFELGGKIKGLKL